MLIDTPDGPRLIKALRPGDLVLTRDHGHQKPLRWLGWTRLSAAKLVTSLKCRPGRNSVGAPGQGLRLRPLLVPALALIGDRVDRVTDLPDGLIYLHLLFDHHEIIDAEGVEVESLLPDWLTREDLPPPSRPSFPI